MSDITRWKVSGPTTRLQPDADGPWVALVDYYRVIDRLIAERDEARGEVKRLQEQVGALTVAVEQADEMKAHAEAAAAAEEAETDRVMSERDAAQAEVERLTAERDEAEAEVERLTQELDGRRATNQRIIAERDAAQRERERVQDLLTCERQELSALRERLRQLRSDQPAQKLDMANGQAIFDSSRPDDETIWREAFMAAIQRGRVYDRMTVADLALAEYRKRWPR